MRSLFVVTCLLLGILAVLQWQLTPPEIRIEDARHYEGQRVHIVGELVQDQEWFVQQDDHRIRVQFHWELRPEPGPTRVTGDLWRERTELQLRAVAWTPDSS